MKKVLCFALFVVTGSAVLSAEEKSKSTKSSEIVVTANRDKAEVSKIPANVTVITADDPILANAQSVPEALKGVDGILVRGVTENPALAEVSMRGFVENAQGRVLVLIDGKRLNNPNMSAINWMQVPTRNVERIEIVRGASSALYGNQAVAGVINIITKKGEQQAPVEVTAQAGTYGTYDAYASAAGTAKGVRYMFNAEHHQSDGYRDNSAFDSTAIGGSMDLDIGGSWSLAAGLQLQMDDYEMPGYLTKEQMTADPRQSNTPDDDSENEYSALDLTLSGDLSDSMRLEVPFSVNRKDSTLAMASWYSYSDTVIDGIKIMPQFVADGAMAGKANKLIFGIDFSIDDLEVDRFADESKSSANTTACVQENILGLYARDEYEAAKDLTLALGARVEQAEIKADVDTMGTAINDSETHNENAVDLSLTQLIDKKVKVYARASTVYRYPFVDEQVSYIGFGSDEFYNDVDPEEGWSVEAGAESDITDNLTAGLSAFIISMDDEITWNAVTMRNENLDQTKREGLEASLVYRPVQRVTLDASYTFMEVAEFSAGEFDGNDIPLVPTHKVYLGMNVALPADVVLDVNASYTGSSYLGGDKANAGPKLDSYTVTDVYLRHKVAVLKGLEVYAGVKNLFDEEYASLAYKGYMEDGYYPSPDRTFLAGASYKF